MRQLRAFIPRLLTLAGLLIGISGCQSGAEPAALLPQLPYYSEATYTPQWFDGEAVPDTFHQIPAFSLTNQLGDPVTEATVAGKVFVVDFFFTACPGICPRMTDNMSLVQQAFADDDGVLLLSHSVTPEYDSVAVLQRYAEDKGVIDGKWHLLTGDRDDIYHLGRNAYFVEEDLGLEKASVRLYPHGKFRAGRPAPPHPGHLQRTRSGGDRPAHHGRADPERGGSHVCA